MIMLMMVVDGGLDDGGADGVQASCIET